MQSTVATREPLLHAETIIAWLKQSAEGLAHGFGWLVSGRVLLLKETGLPVPCEVVCAR